MRNYILTLLTGAAALISLPHAANAMDLEQAKELYDTKISSWLNDPAVTNAINAQNEKHAALSQGDIDDLDAKWRADDATLIDPTLNNALSTYLQGVVEGGEGLYSEIIVMDNKGLNVGQSTKTSDYWQGDEAKFTETFAVGDGAMHVSEVEFDESSQTYQVQLSVTVSSNGAPIGAVTIGVDAEAIE